MRHIGRDALNSELQCEMNFGGGGFKKEDPW